MAERVVRFNDALLEIPIIQFQIFIGDKKFVELKDIAEHSQPIRGQLYDAGNFGSGLSIVFIVDQSRLFQHAAGNR
jgi:hypothetical protein